MPTITATSIISKAQILVQDTTAIRWALSEWLGWLNDGQREIAILRPSASTKIANVSLVAGTKQTLPADAVSFLEYMRNMGAAGTTPGSAVRKVARRLMDSQNPNWHNVTATVAPQHYIFEPGAPKTFYVYPPSTGAQYAEILYLATPADVPAVGSVITLDDIYAGALLDYIVYRAYSKDAEQIGNAERAVLAHKAFEASLGAKAQAEAQTVAVNNERG